MGRRSRINGDYQRPMEKLTILVKPEILEEAYTVGAEKGDKNISEIVRNALDDYVKKSSLEEQNIALIQDNKEILLQHDILEERYRHLEEKLKLYERMFETYENMAKALTEKKKFECHND